MRLKRLSVVPACAAGDRGTSRMPNPNALISADAEGGRLRRIVRTKPKIHRVTPIDKFLLFMRVHQFSPFFQ